MLRRVLFPLFRARSSPVLPTTRLRPSPARQYRPSTSRLSSPSPSPSPSPTPPPAATVSQRLKHLVKSYGWYALGVYFVFSALDFSVAFIGIKLLGAEQVSQAATYVKHVLYGFLQSKAPEPGRDETENPDAGGDSHEGLYAMLVLAYTIHKTVFLPLRVGLTAAFTPRIVGWLRARGWAGAKSAAREARERTKP